MSAPVPTSRPQSRPKSHRVAVIGAGVVGVNVARAIQRSGALVTLYDPHPPAYQTSFGNAAYIAVEYTSPLATWRHIGEALTLGFSSRAAFKLSPDHLWRFLPWSLRFLSQARTKRVAEIMAAHDALNAQALGAWQRVLAGVERENALIKRDYLQVWSRPRTPARIAESIYALGEKGFKATALSAEALCEREPALSPELHGALAVPAAHQLSSTPAVCKQICAAFVADGGEFVQATAVLEAEGDKVSIRVDGKQRRFDQAVVSAGVWSKPLLMPLIKQGELSLPLAVERGYHLSFADATALGSIVESVDQHIVLTQLDEGLRVVGFSEFANLDSPEISERYSQLRQRARQVLAEDISNQTASEWMGRRPTFPDSLPVIDRLPSYPSIGLCFGHQHLGVTQAAISAELIAALMQDERTARAQHGALLAALSVSRF